MKKIAIFTSALLLICGMTGCGKSSGGTAVYTDIDIHDENIIRHCIEQPADDPQPDSWLYTEIVSGDSGRLRYITSTETVGDSEEGTDAAGETVAQPVEIDVFEGAEINVSTDVVYPQSLNVRFSGAFDKVGIECSLISATPQSMTIRATANENASVLKENNYVLKETTKEYEISVSNIFHAFLSADEITPEIENKLIDGMVAEVADRLKSSAEMQSYLYGESVQVPEISPLALYTVLPPENTNFITEEKTSSIGFYIITSSMEYDYYRMYAILTDGQGHYYAAYAVPEFNTDGTFEARYDYLTGDVTTYQALDKYEFDDFESAYACIEEKYQVTADTTVLSEFKTYTDTTSEQQETAESTDAE